MAREGGGGVDGGDGGEGEKEENDKERKERKEWEKMVGNIYTEIGEVVQGREGEREGRRGGKTAFNKPEEVQ